MTVEGADVAQLRSAATQFSKGASALETSAKALHSLIGSATQWRGPDADRFRSQWSSKSTRTINAAVDALRQAADTLQRNADEQDKASAVQGADTVAASVYSGSAAPTGAKGLYQEILSTAKENGSGVRVQEVVGADGVTRFIVYLDGTLGGKDMPLLGNGPAAAGHVDQDISNRINAALTAAGYTPGPNGPEMMLVGYSQGGMDAQNIAASHMYNVQNLVTYGSPLTQADQPGIATVHLRADGDNVPNLPQELMGLDGSGFGNQIPLDSPLSGPSHSIYTADPHVNTGPLSLIIGNHGNQNTYTTVGSDFDHSTDPSLVAKQADIARFQGHVVNNSAPTKKG